MGLRPNKSPAGDLAAQQAGDAQYRETNRTREDRISLLSNQLGAEDRTNIRRFGTRSLLAGVGGSGPLGGLVKATGKLPVVGAARDLLGSLFGGLFGIGR